MLVTSCQAAGQLQDVDKLSTRRLFDQATFIYSNNELDIHAGFRPNRAVLFPSNWIHSSNVCAESKSLPRYTATLFINKL